MANPIDPDSLSVAEMLRIMDVATAIRQDREIVEEQLNLAALKETLRQRMIAAARATGEDVTEGEVDAAIEHYYQSLHTFREPKLSPSLALAHLWVRRLGILKWGGASLFSALLVWWLFLSPSGPLTVTGRQHKRVAALASEATQRIDAARVIVREESSSRELERLQKEALTFAEQEDEARLRRTLAAVASLESRLNEDYAIAVVAAPGKKSGIDRYYKDRDGKRVSGYYLIVEAKTADGKVLPRRIHNAETDKDEEVSTWAERVPREVYERIARDKRQDGILNETAFAVKRKGEAEEVVIMAGSDGQPILRTGQITQW